MKNSLWHLVNSVRTATVLVLTILLLAGCAALDTHQAKLDQKQLREVLMDYTDDQILDNLIRASNGLAIVHFDLNTITATVTSKFTPTIGGGRTVADVNTRTPTHSTATTDQLTGANTTTTAPSNQTVANTVTRTVVTTASVVGGLVETVTKPFTYNMMAERDNAIGVEVDPLLDEPDVYAAYVKFLNTDVPGHEPPPKVSRSSNEKAEYETTKISTTMTEPTRIQKTTSGSAPTPAQAQTSPPGTTEVTDIPATSTTTEEETPKKKASSKLDLIVRDFNSIRSLRRSATAPSPEDVLVGPKRWKDGMYYWVPRQYQKEYFELCVATVARGKPAGAETEKESETVKELKQFNALERQRFLRSQ
ncbi:MAG TPA: hypothetical protein VIW21_11345 [Chthoniobacterales bacterium]|jgi:hypothetical protein